VNRYTFVLQIHPDGPSTLENLSTNERIRIADLGAVGPQVEKWLASMPGSARPNRRPNPARDGAPRPRS
jgi:hypothetical protein